MNRYKVIVERVRKLMQKMREGGSLEGMPSKNGAGLKIFF
jgi:hypothetical protein